MQYTIMMECKPCERENKSKMDVNECSTRWMLMNAVHNYDGMQYTIMMECSTQL